MTTAYTSLLGLALPVTGELSGTWGDTVNTAITSLLDTAVAGTTSITTDADITLTTTTGASNQARQAILLWNPASGTTTRYITAPAQSKLYTVINASGGTQSIVIRGAGPTTGVTIAKGESAMVAWNGSDFVKVSSSGGAITFTDLTVTGNTILGDAAADTLTVNATSTFASPVNFQGLVKLPSTGRSAAAALTVTAPAFLYGVASTYTDTTSSGTIAAMAPFYSIAQPTLATSNVTTYTNASTLYIANAPAAGGSATITNPYALYIAAGNMYFGGSVASNLLFVDNTYDIGASGASRPRSIYLAGNATLGGSAGVTLTANAAQFSSTYAGITTTRLFTDSGGGVLSVDGANSISLRTGGVSGTSALVVNGSSNYVGIGTGSPQELLHLSATTPVFRMQGGSRTFQQYVNGTSFYIRDVTAGLNRTEVDASGYFGINTSGSTLNQYLAIGGSGGTLAGTAAISLWDGNSGGSRRWAIANGASATGISQIGALTISAGSGTFTADPLSAGVEIARFSPSGVFTVNYANPSSSGGYLALNTTSPVEYFDINSNDDYGQFTASLGGSPYLALRFSRGNLSAKTTLVSGDQHNIIFQGYDGSSFYNMARINVFAASTVSAGVVPGRISFDTSASGGNLTAAFHIDQNQYCSINSTVVNNYPLYIGKNPASASEAMLYIYPSTSSNSAHAIFNNSGSGSFFIGRANSSGSVQTYNTGTAYATVIANSGALPIYFGTNNTNAMNLGTNQYIAISNAGAAPSYPLDITTPASTASNPMLAVNPSTSSNAAVILINNQGAGSLYLGRASSTGTGAPASMNAGESFFMHSGNQRLVLGSNSLRALIVDSSGYVTAPYQPSFNAYSSGNQSGAQTPVIFGSTRHNISGSYSTSTGRFTAPVDGVYFFSVTNNVIYANGIDGLIRKNGSNIIGVEYDAAAASVWLGLTATTVLQLSAGDYVDYIIGNGNSTTVEGTPWNNFVGFLIG